MFSFKSFLPTLRRVKDRALWRNTETLLVVDIDPVIGIYPIIQLIFLYFTYKNVTRNVKVF